MTPKELIQYYANLLIWQYKNLPKASGTIKTSITPYIADGYDDRGNDNQLASLVEQAFSLDTATGLQLDILGKYIGVSRIIESHEQLGKNFSYMPAPTLSNAFDLYVGFSEAPQGGKVVWRGHWLSSKDRYDGIAIDDDTYRVLLKFKIIYNNSNFSVGAIDKQVNTFFGRDLSIIDNKDMTITYHVIAQHLSLPAQIAKEKTYFQDLWGLKLF